MAEHESNLAVLVDFENMARPGAKGRGDFDIHLVLNRLAEKGRVLVKRAYADWSRYRDARHELQNAGLGLIEMPSAREGAKNRADIQMAVDAMELAYSREHVNNFVIVSGDSDFTPLVGKLRELNKRVIGVGNRESASELLIANCDEFIFYDRLAAEAAGGGTARRRGGSSSLDLNPVDLLRETLTALQREGVEWPLASIVKDSMRRKYPAFDESEHGFSTFSKFLEEAGTTGIVRLESDPRSGTYRVELGGGSAAAGPPLPVAGAPAAERGGEEAEGGRRRRRRGGRGRSSSDAVGRRGARLAGTEADSDADDIAEVFEVVVTPTPDLDVGTLPPLDEPISYEDMIMLGPEVGDDVPDLTEASDVATGPPSRSSRRRRRRGAGADPEPTLDDLEPVSEDEAPTIESAEVAQAIEALAEDEEGAPRRRRRRRTAAAEDETPVADAIEPVVVEEPAAEAGRGEAPAAEEPAPAGRRRVRRRAATEAAEAVEAPAEAPADVGPVAEEAPEAQAPQPGQDRRAGGGRPRRGDRRAGRRGGGTEAEAPHAQGRGRPRRGACRRGRGRGSGRGGPQAEAPHPQGRGRPGRGRRRGRGRGSGRGGPQAEAPHPQGRRGDRGAGLHGLTRDQGVAPTLLARSRAAPRISSCGMPAPFVATAWMP